MRLCLVSRQVFITALSLMNSRPCWPDSWHAENLLWVSHEPQHGNSVVWASYIVTLYLSLLLCHAGQPRNLEIKQGTCWSLVGSGKMLSLSVMKEGETAMWLCCRTLTQVPGVDAGYSPGIKIFNSSPKAYWVLLGSMWEPALSDLQALSRSGACLPRMTSLGQNFNGSSLTFSFHFWRICFESWVEYYLQWDESRVLRWTEPTCSKESLSDAKFVHTYLASPCTPLLGPRHWEHWFKVSQELCPWCLGELERLKTPAPGFVCRQATTHWFNLDRPALGCWPTCSQWLLQGILLGALRWPGVGHSHWARSSPIPELRPLPAGPSSVEAETFCGYLCLNLIQSNKNSVPSGISSISGCLEAAPGYL